MTSLSKKETAVLDWLAGRERLRVLNAGCGSGELSLRLAAAGHRVVGIDPGADYIDLARANLADRVLPLNMIASEIIKRVGM